jgi:dTDP-4-amino-4,6-dideoxygalactose transaminase
MCDMERIRAIADKNDLFIVEDAAHSLEAEWKGKKAGHYGDFACFSFYATKNITSGEGGAVSAKREDEVELLRKLRLHGLDKSASDRYTNRFAQYDVDIFGWKYNMDNIHAAILIEQMEKVAGLHRRRAEVYARYAEAFEGLDGIELHAIRPESSHAYHLFTILVDPGKRNDMLAALQDRGIGVSVNFHPVHLLTYYRVSFGYKPGAFPVAEEIGSRTISLPLYAKLTEEDISYVIETVKEVVRTV